MELKLKDQTSPIVIVDDEEADVDFFMMAAEAANISNPVRTFRSGESFLGYMESVRTGKGRMPGLVFLDINMPAMNGFEVLEKLKNQDEFKNLPVVVMLTTSTQNNDKEKSYNLGCSDYFVKPYTLDEYVEFFEKITYE